MVVHFGFWNLRGLGQSVRLLLEYAGVEYTEKRYNIGPPPDYSYREWFDDKDKLGMEFPNLPYYFDGTHKITQTHAILKHLGRKHDLIGQNETETIRAEMVEYEAQEWRVACTGIVYKPNFADIIDEYISGTARPKLENFSKFLSEHQWFAGDNLTYVDFIVYELMDIHRILSPKIFENFENLVRFMNRFESLEPIANYMKSERFIHRPVYGPLAGFGGIHHK